MNSVLFAQSVTVKVPHRKEPILKDITFSVNREEFIIVLGHNGSGKSTLLKLLAGDIEFSSGSILLNKMPLKDLVPAKRAQEIITLSQRSDDRLFLELTLAENISLWESRFEKKHRLTPAQILGLTPKPAHFLKCLNQQLVTLSGGEKQAILLALALAHPPEILLLDEHTSALDPKASREIMRLTDITIKNNKITTIMVTHHLEDALNYGDRLIVLKEGEIIIDDRDKKNLTLDKLRKIMDF